jgi:uroporphyrinogen III methyltransferase/synthase
MGRLQDRGFDARQFGRSSIAAIGPGTAASLQDYGLRADCVPAEYRAEALADILRQHVDGRRVLLLRASRGRELLAQTLVQAGALVNSVVAYSSVDVEAADADIAAMMQAGQVTWTVATSSSIAQALARFFGASLHKTRIASISPVTSSTLAELGYPATVEACPHTMQGIIDTIQAHGVTAEP